MIIRIGYKISYKLQRVVIIKICLSIGINCYILAFMKRKDVGFYIKFANRLGLSLLRALKNINSADNITKIIVKTDW